MVGLDFVWERLIGIKEKFFIIKDSASPSSINQTNLMVDVLLFNIFPIHFVEIRLQFYDCCFNGIIVFIRKLAFPLLFSPFDLTPK